jgi:glycosyltransferase involved in cell wall biosynthesis
VKVVIVAPHFHPRVGGVETYALRIASGLSQLGWQVVIVTTGQPGHGDQPEPPGLPGVTVYRLPIALTVSNTPVGWRWRRRLRRIYQAERPDVINAHTPVPYLADVAQRASHSIPFILTYHNDLDKESFIYKSAIKLLHGFMINRTLRRSTRIIATSGYYLRSSRYLQPHESKIGIVPPGVDLTRFNPGVAVGDELAARYAGHRVVLFVGSLRSSQRHKGLDILIRAFASVHASRTDVRLVVVGQGDGLASYRAVAAAAGVANEVDFAGYQPYEQLAAYYKLATALAMPSTSRSEGYGMVFTEAGAVGIPVIGSAIGGVPDAVRHGETGLLVTPKDVDELIDALGRLLDDARLARRLGAAGAARARAECGWPPLAGRTSEIFLDAVAAIAAGSQRTPSLQVRGLL